MTRFSKGFITKMRDNYDCEVFSADSMMVVGDFTEYLIEVYFDIISVTDSCGNIEVMFESEDEVAAFLEQCEDD